MHNNAILKALDHFVLLTDIQKKEILSCFKEHYYIKDKIILREGFTNRLLYFIAKGVVREYQYSLSGTQKTLSFKSSGDFFTDLESFEKRKSSFVSFSAESESVVYTIDYFLLKDLIETHKEIKMAFAKCRAHYLAIKKTRNTFLFTETVESRVIKTYEDYPEIIKHCKKRDIISYLRTNSQIYNNILRSIPEVPVLERGITPS
ncbi:Crp/Fnr family transcriptional regulator [Arcticibacter eurypsychrophilus]|uniref:Crp/Fnr family transcriptional regulator n=1 Tax=Arcticibacter eurypsychrophilus TaxID=1434752 RepID=UPI00084D9D90|nr:cyclic nucleotide-binding domain-containing protein [Arcticibacter eurypsychrophilus]